MPFGIIYQIKNCINGKTYIGQTRQTFQKRYGKKWWLNHHNRHVLRAVEKYGSENFVVSIIDTAENQADLDQKESLHIFKKNNADPQLGYNMTMNISFLDPNDPRVQQYRERDSIIKSSAQSKEETRAQRSVSLKAAHERESWVPEIVAGIKAYHADPENQKKFAEANSRAWSEERRKKNSERVKARYANPEARRAQSERMKAHLANPEAKQQRVAQLAQTRAKAIANAAPALARRNSDPEMQALMSRRAAWVRNENRRRTKLGQAKMTRSEACDFIEKCEILATA